MSRLRQTIAKRLKDAQNTAALLTTFNDVDMSAVIDARARYKDLFEKKHGIRLGFMGFFVKAVALAAKDVPSALMRTSGVTRTVRSIRTGSVPSAVSRSCEAGEMASALAVTAPIRLDAGTTKVRPSPVITRTSPARSSYSPGPATG